MMNAACETRPAPHRARGFSLVELGVTLGIIAIMIIGVIASRGYIVAAKIGATVQMVDTLRKSARAYAERRNSSMDFVGVSIDSLRADGLLPGAVGSPFESPFETPLTMLPDVDPEYINISFDAADATSAQGCQTALTNAGTVAVAGAGVTLKTR